MSKDQKDEKSVFRDIKSEFIIALSINILVLTLLSMIHVNPYFAIPLVMLLYTSTVFNAIYFWKEDKSTAKFKFNFARINAILFYITALIFILINSSRHIFFKLILGIFYAVNVGFIFGLIKNKNPLYNFYMISFAFCIVFQFITEYLKSPSFLLSMYLTMPVFSVDIVDSVYDALTLYPEIVGLKVYSYRIDPNLPRGVSQYSYVQKEAITDYRVKRDLKILENKYKEEYKRGQNLLLAIVLLIATSVIIVISTL